MSKPFSTRELLLRIRAIIRRAATVPMTIGDVHLVFGCLKLDKSAHRMWVEEEEIQVTALEFRLVETFLARKGRVQTRDTLLLDVWGYDAAVTTRTVDTHIKRLVRSLSGRQVHRNHSWCWLPFHECTVLNNRCNIKKIGTLIALISAFFESRGFDYQSMTALPQVKPNRMLPWLLAYLA